MTDTNTIILPADRNKDDICIACYEAARAARERGHPNTAKGFVKLAQFIDANNGYSAKDLHLLDPA